MNELEPDRDVTRRLHDLDATVIHEREHRGRHAARDAALERVEVVDTVEVHVVPARRHRRRLGEAGLGQPRHATVPGLEDQRREAVRIAGLDPVAHADAVARVLAVVAGRHLGEALGALGVLLVGEVAPLAVALGTLDRCLIDMIDRPHAAQIRCAPRRPGQSPVRIRARGRFLSGRFARRPESEQHRRDRGPCAVSLDHVRSPHSPLL